jgi:hypothetical protein
MGLSPAHKLIMVEAGLLRPGMYVAELDRPLHHAPCGGAGFLITSAEQLAGLRRVCRYVYVDPDLSEPQESSSGPPDAPANGPLERCRRTLQESLDAVGRIVRAARRQGVVDLGAVERCASRLVDEVIAAPDALHWTLRHCLAGPLLHRRALGTAAVAATLGRRIGFERPALEALASGGLLLDLGKIAVPVPILAKPGALDGCERGYVRRHVERGIELLGGRDVPPRALEMLGAHHERVDGSGYPRRLRGTQIPLFGRIAAVADVFDALTLDRHYAAAMSPHAALRQLQALGDARFDSALVEELVHALGVYPVGTPVGLGDGSAGFVCAQRARLPLQPHVLVSHDVRREPLAEPRVVAAEGALAIVRALPAHVLRPDALRERRALEAFHAAGS